MNIVCSDNKEVNPKRILERTFTLTICYTSLAYNINCTRHKDTVILEKKSLVAHCDNPAKSSEDSRQQTNNSSYPDSL